MQSLFFCSKTGEKEGGCTFYKFLTAHLTISCPWDSEGKSYNDRDTEVFPSDLMEVKDMDDRQRQQIRELREEGYGYGRIAQILEISENTIKTYCRRHGLGGVATNLASSEGKRQ